MSEIRSLQSCGPTLSRNSYAYWQALLAGEAPELPRDVPMYGRYWKQQRDGSRIGVCIDPTEDGSAVQVRIGKAAPQVLTTPAEVEDFSELIFAWCAKNVVTHEAYVAWWTTGDWPEGAIKEKPKAARAKTVAKTEPAPAVQPIAPDGAVLVRVYATLEAASSAENFYARAIARDSKGREDFSVGFYAETAEAAAAKARAWIVAERERQQALVEGRLSAAERRKQARAARSESLEANA